MLVSLSLFGVAASLPASAARSSGAPSGQIAFVRGGDIWVMDADGGSVRRLTTSFERDSSPAWSPDGGNIAFLRDGSADGFDFCLNEIWLMNADGSNQRRIPFSLGPQVMPGTSHEETSYAVDDIAWSPDGQTLAVGADAYSSYPDMAGGLFAIQLYLMQTDGTKPGGSAP